MIIFIFGILLLLFTFIIFPKFNTFNVKHKEVLTKFVHIIQITLSIFAIFCIVMSCITTVHTGYTGIVTTFGKVHDNTLDAGINFHMPWDNVVMMDNREQRSSFSLQAFSKDIQQVDIQGSINYNIDKTTAMNLYRNVGTNYVKILIEPRIQEDVKIIIAQYTAEKLIENRQVVADAIFTLISEELDDKGINVLSFAIENVDFTDAFEAAVEAKQVATQEKQRAQTQQEQQTMEAEQAAARRQIAANADAEVARIEADAVAYATKVKAEAEAAANALINASLTEQLIDYTKIQTWNGQLPVISGGNTPILDVSDLIE